jgi:O-antigen ligase
LYSFWTGAAEFVGATTSKNMLGVACLVSGLFFFWDTVSRWPERRKRGVKKVLALNISFIAMTWWLLNLSHSTTSTVCLVLGCVLISASRLKMFRRRLAVIKALGPLACCLYLVVSLGLGMNGQLAQAVGKDATLTDRTKIWDAVLSMHTNPLVGTGYESFWMGPRLDEFSEKSGLVGINEAHNGYLEVYLNLGIIGLALLLVFLISSYGSACKRLKVSFFATLNIAVWTALLFYSITEAGFRSGVMWLTFLLGAMNVPRRVLGRVKSALPVKIQTPETTDLVLPSQRM